MTTGRIDVRAGGAGTRNSATQAVRKAVQVLNCFTASERTSLGVTEVSVLTGWSKSSVSRLLAALEDGGLVRQDPATGRYTPGLQLVALAGAALAGDALYHVARPHLLRLAAKSGETANLSVLDQGQLLTIDEAPSAQAIKLSGWVGVRHPLHGSSSGKVLLAGLSDERRAAIFDAGLPAVAPCTTTDRGHLLHELERVRIAGYALSVEELAEGLTSVAAPVWDHTGTVAAAISAAGPSFRFAGRHLDDCIALVKEVALDASRGLGYRVPAAS
jgi:DNA-binding IclR family transcriptional regulator